MPPKPFVPPRGTPETSELGLPPSARWTTASELAGRDWVYQPGRIFLGRSGGKLIGVNDPRHMMTVAGSRAGKSKSCLVPNLYLWPGSAVVIDPKGEIATLTAERRASAGQAVYIVDPFDQVRDEKLARYRASFNPLAELVRDDKSDVPDDAALIADALILESAGGDSHWTTAAKSLIKGLILYLVHLAEPRDGDGPHNATVKQPTLNALRELVTLPIKAPGDDPDLMNTFEAMANLEDDGFGGVMANIGSAMGSKSEGELRSIISTAEVQTDFLGGKLASVLGSSEFTMGDLKQRPMTVFLVLPASRMGTHSRWLRLMVSLALLALETDETKPEHRVLVVLEEFAQLGYLRQLEAAVALMAGYGVLIWTILQDFNQLVAHYRDSWETFVGNAGVLQAFANADERTLKFLSDRLGSLTLREDNSVPITHAMAAVGDGNRTQLRTTPLLAPFEIALHFGRQTEQQLVLIPDRTPAAIERVWFDDPVLGGSK
jgi:type IV secretion system protein VirD4